MESQYIPGNVTGQVSRDRNTSKLTLLCLPTSPSSVTEFSPVPCFLMKSFWVNYKNVPNDQPTTYSRDYKLRSAEDINNNILN